jgi:hypothetical protein
VREMRRVDEERILHLIPANLALARPS